MSLKSTLAAMSRPLSLVLEDKALLPQPLLAVALYDFEGEPEMAELTFAKGQMLMVFCEDFGASWSLAMLVDAQGNELPIDGNDRENAPKLTRGLIAQGFYEYVSEPTSPPASSERHHAIVDSRDDLSPVGDEEPPSSPTDTILATEPADVNGLDHASEAQSDHAPIASEQENVETPLATADISTDYLDESSIEASIIVVVPDKEQEHGDTPAETPAGPSTVQESLPVHCLEAVATTGDDPKVSVGVHTLPLAVSPALAAAPRLRQTSTSSLLKSSNPVEAYLQSDLPFEPPGSLDARDVIEIEDGKWVSKIPPFHITVPTYSQRRVAKGRGEYTVFQIVSSVTAPNRHSQAESSKESDPGTNGSNGNDAARHLEVRQITVDRRYTHFQHLHTILKATLPLLTLPDLPEKRLTGNFNADFLNSRRKDLERYLSRLARHELIRSNKAFLDFLGSENEEVYDANLPRTLMHALRTEPERFFARIKYEADYFDEQQLLEEATEEHDRMARHVRAVEKGQAPSAIYDAISSYRDRLQGTGSALSDLALSLTSLVSGLAQPKGSVAASDDEGHTESADRTRRRRERARAHNMQNSDGAFCWRESCPECLGVTKAVQEAAEAISLVADLYDANARTVLLIPQEQLIEYSLPRQRYQSLLANAKVAQDQLATLLRQDNNSQEGCHEKDAQKRAEVALNSLLAEIQNVHTERREDLQRLALTLLNGQIAFHERALLKLRAARATFESGHLEELSQQGLRLPSFLEKAVLDPPKARPALPRPSTYGLPAAPQSTNLRPITSLVSTLFSGAVGLSGSWRSAISAIKAQTPAQSTAEPEDLRERLASPTLASSSRFVQFLDWTMNSRGEQRQYA